MLYIGIIEFYYPYNWRTSLYYYETRVEGIL